jgi:hypothetical protein
MKKTLVLFTIFCLLAGLLAGCSGKKKNAIEMYVDDYGYAYSFSEISKADNGNTVIEMTMLPIKNANGETADLLTALNVGGLFLMEVYIVCDGKEYEYNENSAFAVDSGDDNSMSYVYKYEFDTDLQPEMIFFYPANRRGEVDYHWQIDPNDGSILKEAAIIEE